MNGKTHVTVKHAVNYVITNLNDAYSEEIQHIRYSHTRIYTKQLL